MAEGNDDPQSPPFKHWDIGKKKRRTIVDSNLTSPSMEQLWLQERELEKKRLENPAPEPDSKDEEW